jgi:hypothetical protein
MLPPDGPDTAKTGKMRARGGSVRVARPLRPPTYRSRTVPLRVRRQTRAASARRSRPFPSIKGECTRKAIEPRAFALDRRTGRGDTPCRAGLRADTRGEEIQARAFALDRRQGGRRVAARGPPRGGKGAAARRQGGRRAEHGRGDGKKPPAPRRAKPRREGRCGERGRRWVRGWGGGSGWGGFGLGGLRLRRLAGEKGRGARTGAGAGPARPRRSGRLPVPPRGPGC